MKKMLLLLVAVLPFTASLANNEMLLPYHTQRIIKTPPTITGGSYTQAAPGYGTLSSGMNVICGYYNYPIITFDLEGTNEIYSVQVLGNPTPAWSVAGNEIQFDGFSEPGQVVTFRVTVANSSGSNTYDYTFYQWDCPAISKTK